MKTRTSQRTELGRPINWVGTLSETPLAEVAKRVAAERRSGDLQVTLGDTIKTVYFSRGVPVSAASSLETDRLGETLIENGRLDRNELDEAMRDMKARGTKLGRTLVDSGMMSEVELEKRLTRQAGGIVRSMFAIEDGIYSFDERDCPIVTDERLSIPLAQLMLEGSRQLANIELIVTWLPSPDESLRASASYSTGVAHESLRPLERDLLQAAKEGTSLFSVMEHVNGNHKEVLQACYGLYSANLLEPFRETPLTAAFRAREVERPELDAFFQWALVSAYE